MGFSNSQKHFIEKGALERHAMVRQIQKIAQAIINPSSVRSGQYLDAIIFGTTGIGKTHKTQESFRSVGIEPVIITGATKMFAFATNLMVYHYNFTKHRQSEDEKMVIILDDCDSFFETKENINILKGMSGKPGTRRFQYNTTIMSHLLTEEQKEIIEHYRPEDGRQGFSISTDDIIFIITTNHQLPYEQEANQYLAERGPTATANRKMDLAAIRGRFNCKDFNIPDQVKWGWIAEVALNDGGLYMLEDPRDKEALLDWMWYNWDRLKEHNIRTMEKLAWEMVEDPENYKDNWETDFIIKTPNS